VVLEVPLLLTDELLEELSGCVELLVVMPLEELEPDAGV